MGVPTACYPRWVHLSRRSTRLMKALLPIPIAAGLAALLLLSGCSGVVQPGDESDLTVVTTVRVHSPAVALWLRGDKSGSGGAAASR